MKTADTKLTRKKPRLDLENWLELALEALATKGPQVLTVEKLCRELGVSRGSFYWHFKNRADFVKYLADFWDKRFTTALKDIVATADTGPAERLLLLIQLIEDLDVTRFDIPVRAWAATEPLAAEFVRRTDKTRYRFVRSLFAELGFAGEELEMRTRTFVVYQSMDAGLTVQESRKKKKRLAALRHRLLTGH